MKSKNSEPEKVTEVKRTNETRRDLKVNVTLHWCYHNQRKESSEQRVKMLKDTKHTLICLCY